MSATFVFPPLQYTVIVSACFYSMAFACAMQVEEATKNMAENRSFWAAKEEEQAGHQMSEIT